MMMKTNVGRKTLSLGTGSRTNQISLMFPFLSFPPTLFLSPFFTLPQISPSSAVSHPTTVLHPLRIPPHSTGFLRILSRILYCPPPLKFFHVVVIVDVIVIVVVVLG